MKLSREYQRSMSFDRPSIHHLSRAGPFSTHLPFDCSAQMLAVGSESRTGRHRSGRALCGLQSASRMSTDADEEGASSLCLPDIDADILFGTEQSVADRHTTSVSLEGCLPSCSTTYCKISYAKMTRTTETQVSGASIERFRSVCVVDSSTA